MFKTRLSNSHLYSPTLGCVQLSGARCVSMSDRLVSLSLPLLECNTSLPFQDHLAVTPFRGPDITARTLLRRDFAIWFAQANNVISNVGYIIIGPVLVRQF